MTFNKLLTHEEVVNLIGQLNQPRQVMFKDYEEAWQAGIAFNDVIICGCCGGIYELDEIECMYVFDSWNDLRYEIIGDFIPPEA